MKVFNMIFAVIVFAIFIPYMIQAQTESSDEPMPIVHSSTADDHDIRRLEVKIDHLETEIEQIKSTASDAEAYIPFVLMIFGAFSALWAQNTGRSALLWFFLGYCFSVITVLVILYKNPQSRHRQQIQY